MADVHVPDGTSFDLPSEGAALYPASHASLKCAAVGLNDSLDGDDNSELDGVSGKENLDDSLDLESETCTAAELMGPVTLTGSLHPSQALTQDEPTVNTVFTKAAQQDSPPPAQSSAPMATESPPVQPAPLPLTEESTSTNEETMSTNHTQESVAHGTKIAPSFGKRKPAFKPPKVSGNTTATVPSQLQQGKLKQVDKSPVSATKVAANKSTPLQTQPSEKVAEEESAKGKDNGQSNSDVQKVTPKTSTKLEQKSKKQVDDEQKRTEKEKKNEEIAKKKLLQQQKKLEKEQKLQEKRADRERKKQEQERKEREREEKKQERERKEQERAQKKCERELKKQEKEQKKQDPEKKRLGKEQQKQAKKMFVDNGSVLEPTSNTTSPSPAALPTSASMSSSSSQTEGEFTDKKGSSGDNEEDGRAQDEEMEEDNKVHVDSLAASSSKEDDLDTTVEGDCSDDQSEVCCSIAAWQPAAETPSSDKVTDMEANSRCAEPLDDTPNLKTIPKVSNVFSSNPTLKTFTPPHASKATVSQKRSAENKESNSRPCKKAKAKCTEEKNAVKPKEKENTSQKLKAEAKAEKGTKKQKLRAAGVQPQKPLPVWVQCGSCKKWRLVHDCADPSTLPDEWTCNMNSDVSVQSCSAPEMDWPDLTNSQEYVYSQFARGSVVWAKQQGYPSWPGMIDNDPDLGVCMSWEEEDPPEDVPPSEYHVVYFGKPVSRAWVEAADMEPFTENCPQNEGNGAYAKALDAAKREAQAALQETTEVRLSKYSFAKRFGKGKRKSQRRCADNRDDDEVVPAKKSRRLPVKVIASGGPLPSYKNLLQDNCSHDETSADTKEVVEGDKVVGDEPAFANPTIEGANSNSSQGK